MVYSTEFGTTEILYCFWSGLCFVLYAMCPNVYRDRAFKPSIFLSKNKLRCFSFEHSKAKYMICLTFILHFVITSTTTNLQKPKCPKVQNCKSVYVVLRTLYTSFVFISFFQLHSSEIVHAHELFFDRIAFLWPILFFNRCTVLR